MVAERALYNRKDIVARDDEKLDSVGELRINYRGQFSASYLYVMMHEWFIDAGFVKSRANDSDFPEAPTAT